MKKSHGPAFRAARIELAKCPACRGRAVTQGVFHELPCLQCNASGWVSAETGQALPLELQAAEQRIEQLKRPMRINGPSAQYTQNNRRGAGGTNLTGD